MNKLEYEVFDKRDQLKVEKTVIFIHGAMNSKDFWKFQTDELSKYFRVIALNLPSHLGSFGPKEPTMETYTSAIKELIIELNLDKPILCGHSMGGGISLSLYFDNPELIGGLVLVGSGAKLRVRDQIIQMANENYLKLIEILSRMMFSNPDFPDNKVIIEELTKKMQKMADSKIGYYDFLICNKFNVMNRLNEILIPTLIICGKDDIMTPEKYSKFLHDNISGSKFNVIKGTGHYVMLEKPNEVNQLIKDFVISV